MSVADPKIQAETAQIRRPIRQLDDAAANRIAAGEVVERPASAVKELVENAIDAKARRIEVAYADGGKTLLRVSDDGHGIPEDQLPLALSRHATSKIDGSDLLNIHTFGFRGEALPSLGAVGRLSITSRADGAESAAQITVHGGDMSAVRPAALSRGTVVELRDLFHATPARLKFLRTDRAESGAIIDVIKRLAMAEPMIGFTLRDVSGGGEGRVVFQAEAQSGDLFDALHARLAKILGSDFAANALRIDAEREAIAITGFASLPTYSRGSATAQYMFVNGRPVRDKVFYGAIRGAYSDFLHRERHPALALFLECDPTLVDVNVHPAKSEVRFRDPGLARGLIVSALRHGLAGAGHRASTTVADATLGAFRPENRPEAPVYQMQPRSGFVPQATPQSYAPPQSHAPMEPAQGGFAETAPAYSARMEPVTDTPVVADQPLGAARAQVHENYVIAQTTDGIVIVDQHAAHERLVYERLKKQMAQNGVAAQALLIPEIVELEAGAQSSVLAAADELAQFGLVVEDFGGNAVCVRETPALLGEVDAQAMIRDIADELADLDQTQTLKDRIEAILSRVACHGSIRSGRMMRAEEMNALLREMEATPHSGQCNHGRPTYVELKLTDIEKLFGRR
ncbi:MAG: DNA mismatch repair endonuclease MutL [Rhodobacteraceae bacterium]|nr:DNA mismatch repair endonuclease MutL [Paracoccaceae bacterium]